MPKSVIEIDEETKLRLVEIKYGYRKKSYDSTIQMLISSFLKEKEQNTNQQVSESQ